MKLALHFLAACTSALAIAPNLLAQAPPLPANATIYASGLNGPRGLAFAPDGTLYVAEAGVGGTVSTVGICTQVPAPIGPYKGGTTGRISMIDSKGKRTTLAHDLPSDQDAVGDEQGISDISFVEGDLYALVAGGGCDHGNPTLPNGIVKVNLRNGHWDYITDLSLFYQEHPAKYVDAGDFEPSGAPYSMLTHKGRLFVVEANHGMVTATATDGATHQIIDISFSQGHVVPTSLASNGENLYLGTLGQFPIQPTFERVLTLAKDFSFFDTTPGLETKASDYDKFRVANSRAGFTTIISLKFGPDGLLYALEFSDAAGYPTPGVGKVVRLNVSGKIEDVVTGLTVPTGMTFGPDRALYVSNLGAAGPGAGQILRISVPD